MKIIKMTMIFIIVFLIIFFSKEFLNHKVKKPYNYELIIK